ncbi:MAG: DUF4175 family protein [Planctomycetota bacterium]
MTDTNTTAAQSNLGVESRLRRLWTKQSGLLVLRGAYWVLAAAGALVLADLLLDWQLDLPGGLRVALLATNVVLLAYVAYRRLLRHLRSYNAVQQALQVEREWPELNGLVVSSVQFGREDDFPPGVSRDLMRAVRRQAAQRTAPLDFNRVTRQVVLRGATACLLAAMLALVIVGFGKPGFLEILASRMFNPSSAIIYPTRTTIEVHEGAGVVRSGKEVTLAAHAGGEVPEHGQVFIRMKGAGWEAVEVGCDAAAEFCYRLPHVSEDFDYYFRLGDAKSARYQVAVARPPRIVEGRVELEYPEYTHLKNQTVDTLNLKVPEGTLLRWHLTLDRAVESAELKPEGADPRAMTLKSAGREANLQLAAEASRPYTINFRWRLADAEYVEPGAKHYMQVIPDADPQVGLLRPGEDAKATLKKTVRLSYWARDDYGLGEASIVYSINDGGERRHPLGQLGGKTSIEKEFSWPITQLLPTLKFNDIVTFAVEATDGRPGTPGHGRSIARRVQFVSDNEYIAYVLARQRKVLGQLRPLYLQEREAAGRLEAIGKLSTNLVQQASLEAARQEVIETQLTDLINRFGDLIEDMASNRDVAMDVSKIAANLQDRLATIRDVRLKTARKQIDEALHQPAVAGPRLAEAQTQIELAARELGSLLVQAGISQACEVFAAELREIIARQETILAASIVGWDERSEPHQKQTDTAAEPTKVSAQATADQQKVLAERIEKLMNDIRSMRESPADALAAVRLARARKIIESGHVATEMRQAAEEFTAKPPSAVERQSQALKGMRQALLKLRPDARLEELVRARNLLRDLLDSQKIMRANLVKLTAEEMAQQKAAMKFRQEAILRPAQQLDHALEIDPLLDAVHHAGQEASVAIGSADVAAATAAEVRVETAISAALVKLGDQIAKLNMLGETHKRMMEAADRLKMLTEIRDRAEQIKNGAFDAAAAGKGLEASAVAQQQLAKDIGTMAAGLPASSKFAAAMRRPLKKTSQITQKAAASLKANKLDAAMPELLKAEQTLKEAFEIAKRELGVLEKLWLFQQASADLKQIRLTIEDIESEQADLRGDVESARKAARTALDLAGPQALLARATQQVQDNVAAIREASPMKEPLDGALTAMNQTVGHLEKDRADAAIDSQKQASAALQNARKLSGQLINQIDLLAVEIDAAAELSGRAMDLLQRQIVLRETTEEAEATDFTRLVTEQDILLAETTVLTGLTMAPKAAEAFQRAADEMTAAIKELKASARGQAVEHQKKAEAALRAGIVALDEYILSMISLLESKQKFIDAFDGMTAILLLATEQRELRELTQRSPDAVLPTQTEKQTELHERCLVVSNMSNIVIPTARITGWEHIEAAAKAMDQAIGTLKASAKSPSITHQVLAEKELRIAFAMNLVELVQSMKPPLDIPLPPLPPEKQPPVAVSIEHWVEFTKASSTGKAVQGRKAEWNSLMDRERAALNENFARELPLEFRKLLKDYYEALAK